MKGLAITSKGLEETASTDIKELIGAKCRIEESCVIFDFKKFENLCLLCYKAQSVDRILYLIDDFKFKNFAEEFEKFIGGLDLKSWAKKHKNFRVECIRIGQHNFKSTDAESQCAKLILNKYRDEKLNFNLKEYEIIFFIYIVNDRCYFGIGFSGFALNKRAYKIFMHPGSLRGTIAYALLRESGFGKKDILLDPFSRDGVVAIEAAFYALDFPLNYFKKDRFAFMKLKLGIDYGKLFIKIDNKIKKSKPKIYAFDHLFKYVDFSKKNAKIAGVEKSVSFSRVELEWLDIKFKKESVDIIATNPPISKNANLDNIYNEFFYQAEYILKKEGRMAIITRTPDFVQKHAEKHNFIIENQKKIWSGEQELNILILKKKSI
jgi:23S rRNA G2445 N2-methylase RlmL